MNVNNTLWYGDNLEILQKHIKDESVDLIYLDPPFSSNTNYNILYNEPSGKKSQAQIEAFTDTWRWCTDTEVNYRHLIENTDVPPKVSQLMLSLKGFLGTNDMSAYLVMMAVRLLEMHRILKDTGSIYLHCDPTASHYLKTVMDSVFGVNNFRNEIIWHYRRGGSIFAGANKFPREHDTIFWYSKTKRYKFNEQRKQMLPKPTSMHGWTPHIQLDPKTGSLTHKKILIYNQKEYEKEKEKGLYTRNRYYTTHIDPTGKMNPDDGTWKIVDRTDKTQPVTDVWNIPYIYPKSKERLGYPTQKPLTLLERIIKSSSDEGDLVLDPFCGSGTTVAAAQRLNRKWIGIDITYLAINLIISRLKQENPKLAIETRGVPKDLESAKFLASQSKTQFEYWALSLVGARPQRPDKGVDGVLYLYDEHGKQTRTVIVQVKGGGVNPGMIRDFRGTIERENAYAGVFITLEEPTTGMRTEASTLGFAEEPKTATYFFGAGQPIPRLQIITLEELFNGKKPILPYKNVTLSREEHSW